ncbi:MAG TPA: hypothetical protein VHC49_06115 [Mycobacteriales bacterium]|nr:hypothetical protein [Mycobacteriales bacterium]
MTLAYVFWHRPRPDVSAEDYAKVLRRFHESLAAAAIPGFGRSWTVRVAELPWLGAGPVYEDRYLIDDYTALGVLNGAAVAVPGHDAAATRAASGTAGLYRLMTGEPDPAATRAHWFDKPAGTAYQDLDPAAGGSLWQRQLTLGPGPEFQLLGGSPAPYPGPETTIEPL